jgi:phosphoserine phosphatase
MIVVIDLDKTLLTVDSYPKWAFFLLRRAIATIDPRTFILVFSYTTLRALRVYDHLTYKKKLMMLNNRDDLNQEFAKSLAPFFRKTVLDYIKNIKNDHTNAKFILSTAAPINYIEHLPAILPFKVEHLFASKIENKVLVENSGQAKVDSFQKVYPNSKCDIFMTDHSDDLPMMKFSDKVVLVGPSQSTIDMVKNRGINVEFTLKDN